MAFFRLAVRSISHKAHSYTKSFSLEKAPLDKFRIKYNGNYVKTPSQTTIVVPNSAIGELLLAEWRNDFSPLKERPQPVVFLLWLS
jgi:chaperone required for assembly of F1-ATPase